MKDLKSDNPIKKFEQFTNSERMKAVFQQRLPEFSQGKLIITHCKIEYTRYKNFEKERSRKKTSLSVYYHLQVTDTCRQRNGAQIFYAKTYLEGRSEIEFQKARTAQLTPPEFGEALVHLPDLGMIVWAFPNDPALCHLHEVIDPKRVKHYLPYDMLPSGLDGPKDVTDVKVDVIRYKPEVRCITRYKLQWGPSDRPQTLKLYGKTFKHDWGQDIYCRIENLWKRSLENPEGFIVTQPLGYNKIVKTVWQVAMPGVPLINIINRTNYKEFLEYIAKGLAYLHKSDISSPIRMEIKDHLDATREGTGVLMQAFPQFKGSLQSIVLSLEKSAPFLTPIQDRLIHGDFLMKQLVIHEGRIGVFDFDDFAIGDPIQDIANFIMDLHFQGFDSSLVDLMVNTFFSSYRSQVDWEVPVDRLVWHIRVQFMHEAYYFYKRKHLQPGFDDEIQHIISLAQKGMVLEIDY